MKIKYLKLFLLAGIFAANFVNNINSLFRENSRILRSAQAAGKRALSTTANSAAPRFAKPSTIKESARFFASKPYENPIKTGGILESKSVSNKNLALAALGIGAVAAAQNYSPILSKQVIKALDDLKFNLPMVNLMVEGDKINIPADLSELPKPTVDALEIIKAGINKAIANNDLKALMEFYDNGVNIDIVDSSGISLLLKAARLNNTDLMRTLVRANGNINVKDRNRFTPLHWSVQNGNSDAVKIALAGGAEIDARDSAGNTPLAIAVSNGHSDIAGILLDAGADVTITNLQNSAVLDLVKLNPDIAKVFSSKQSWLNYLTGGRIGNYTGTKYW